jgi:hypothetical protein
VTKLASALALLAGLALAQPAFGQVTAKSEIYFIGVVVPGSAGFIDIREIEAVSEHDAPGFHTC